MGQYVKQEKIDALNEKVYEKASIDREHLMEFLTYIDTNDAQSIIAEVREWLNKLHNDPKFDKVRFPTGDIDAIIGDLDSYGRVQPEHILQFKQSSSRSLPLS